MTADNELPPFNIEDVLKQCFWMAREYRENPADDYMIDKVVKFIDSNNLFAPKYTRHTPTPPEDVNKQVKTLHDENICKENAKNFTQQPETAEEVDRVGFRLIQAMGFSHSMSNGDHVVSGYGFSARHTSLGCIARRIGEYIAALQPPTAPAQAEAMEVLKDAVGTADFARKIAKDLLMFPLYPPLGETDTNGYIKCLETTFTKRITELLTENNVRAALQPLARPVIKPLVWVDGEYLSSAWALGPVRYKAQFSVTGNAWDLFLGDAYLSEHGERDEAKAAAEAHKNEAIGKMLVPAPKIDGLREAINAVEKDGRFTVPESIMEAARAQLAAQEGGAG